MADTDEALTELFGLDEPEAHAPRALGVVGSREWPDKRFACREVLRLLKHHPTLTTIVSGCQPKGVDGWAEEIAAHFELEFLGFPPAHDLEPTHPRYRPYSPGNYHDRNRLIAEHSDILIAFRWQRSSGTSSTIRFAKARLCPDRVIIFDWPENTPQDLRDGP